MVKKKKRKKIKGRQFGKNAVSSRQRAEVWGVDPPGPVQELYEISVP